MVSTLILERVLDTYSLNEIFEWNELSETEVLQYLLDQGFLVLPNPTPTDLIDD